VNEITDGIPASAAARAIPVASRRTGGRLPSGQDLRDAVAKVDAATGAAPAYYMVNCAHPTHFEDVLAQGGLERFRGLRANASTKSHAELDEAEELDQGDPGDLAARYREFRPLLPGLNVVGGCCGTDERHIETICAAFS
jgi:S-methylmethionine-dependent homocysteine/selenocysteine methylase